MGYAHRKGFEDLLVQHREFINHKNFHANQLGDFLQVALGEVQFASKRARLFSTPPTMRLYNSCVRLAFVFVIQIEKGVDSLGANFGLSVGGSSGRAKKEI